MDGVVARAGDEEAAIRSECHVVRTDADRDVTDALVLSEVDDADAAAAPVRDVEVLAVAAEGDRVRMLADRNGLLEQEGVRRELPELMATFVADVDDARRRVHRDAGEEDRAAFRVGLHLAGVGRLAVLVIEDMDHTRVAAADIEASAIGAERQAVEGFLQREELRSARLVERDDRHSLLIITRAHGQDRFLIRGDHHAQSHVTAGYMRSGRGHAPAVEEQRRARGETGSRTDRGGVDVFAGLADGRAR